MVNSPTLDQLCINTIRGLSMDGVQQAKSGHPGLPMGAAAFAYTLWMRHLKHNPTDPKWFDRDRFILSAGHGSMLLYSLLHLTGYDLPLDELRRFRQWGSKTPGHPENTHTKGVEMATGPLGQGISTATGFAIAESYLAAKYNKPGHNIVDHFTYVICSDGDLMEGISNEAGSLAGHLKLGKLIVVYDDNSITIDGSTSIAFTESVSERYKALGWHVQEVDGFDVEAVDQAIHEAKQTVDKPSLIKCKTIIGYGSPHKAGTSKCHGAPLGDEEVKLSKEALGIPTDPLFYIPTDALSHFRTSVESGKNSQNEWEQRFASYSSDFPAEATELSNSISGFLAQGWNQSIPTFSDKLATRKSGSDVLNAISAVIPNLIGGSADLAESNLTHIGGSGAFQADSRNGRNICFGIREHAMAAAVNGMNLHGGVKAYGSTFLIFSDYCKPSLRLASIMKCPSIFVFTHDSVGVGEDGPTHQPIEQLASLRAIPNFNIMRPADGNETAACWEVCIESRETPCALALSRQALPALTPSAISDHPAKKGAYVLSEAPGNNPEVILLATGSEVSIAVQASEILAVENIRARVVSMPSWFIFEKQSQTYRDSILPRAIPTVSVEAGSTFGWSRYAQAHVGIDTFGASAPGDITMREFGFTAENVVKAARTLLRK